MITLNGKKILVVGFAREGQATLSFLQREAKDSIITVCDQDAKLPPIEGTQCFFGSDYLVRAGKQSYDIIIRSPGIAPVVLGKYLHAETVTTAAALFLERAPGLTIGVTGTKGKSTTASLIAHLLSATYADVRLVGNIGKPALDYLPGATGKTIFVCELSSFQLEDAHYSPQIAVLLPIAPEHLDHHLGFEPYVQAKGNIFRYQAPTELLVCEPETASLFKGIDFRRAVLPGESVFWRNGSLFINQEVVDVREAELKIKGPAALSNICYAVTVALFCKVPVADICTSLKTFEPLPHRLQPFVTKRGTRYINDSLSTVPEALLNALKAFAGEIDVVIAGGHDRGISYDSVGHALVAAAPRSVLLFHGTGEKIEQALRTSGYSGEVLFISSMLEAVSIASQKVRPGRVVLMSPASSSFNHFKDYADRGEQFIKAVEQVEHEVHREWYSN